MLKKRILIANYLTIRILFGAANGIRTRDPQLGKLMLYQLSYCRISKTETKVIYIFQPTKYKQTIFTITIKKRPGDLRLTQFKTKIPRTALPAAT